MSSPVFMPKSSYQSLNPEFKVFGIEKKPAVFRIWIVATPESLNNLKSLRTITSEIYLHVTSNLPKEAEWEAIFYTAAIINKDNVTFHESNYLGLYMSSEQEFFMVDGRSAKLEP